VKKGGENKEEGGGEEKDKEWGKREITPLGT
jgi:hypothetical protein